MRTADKVALLYGSAVATLLQADFTGQKPTIYKGGSQPSITAIPGWSFTGGVSGGQSTSVRGDGTIAYYNQNVPRITAASSVSNLVSLTSTAYGGAGWTQGGVTVVTGVSDPNGAATGVTVTSTGSAISQLYRASVVEQAGQTITVSIAFKPGTSAFVWIDPVDGSTNNYTYFNGTTGAQAGALPAGVTTTTTPLANGFIRITATKTLAAGSSSQFFTSGISDSSSSTTSTAGKTATFAWPMINPDPVAKSYLPNPNTMALTVDDFTAVRGNLIQNSNDLTQASWGKLSGATVSGNVITFSAPGTNQLIQQTPSGSGIGSAYNWSVTLSGSGTVHIDISATGGVTLPVTLTATPTRYSVQATMTATGGNVRIVSTTGDTATSVTYANAQAEPVLYTPDVFTYPSAYIPTTSAPIYVYDTQLFGRGLLVEQAATNLQPQSADQTSINWSVANATIARSTLLGSDNATLLNTVTATATANRVNSTGSGIVVTSGVAYTLQAELQKGSSNFGGLVAGNGAAAGAIYNLSSGVVVSTVGTGASATIKQLANGNWLCTLTFATTGTAVQAGYGVSDGSTYGSAIYPSAASGTINGGMVQLELGSLATSYIATTTTAVTRAADDPDVAPFSVGQQGAALVTATPQAVVNATVNGLFSVNGGSSADRIDMRQNPVGALASIGSVGGVAQWTITNGAASYAANTPYRAGLTWRPGAQQLSFNGGAPVTAAGAAVPTAFTRLRLGNLDNTLSSPLNGFLRSLTIYNTANPAALR